MKNNKQNGKYKVRGYTGAMIGFSIGILLMAGSNFFVLFFPEMLNTGLRIVFLVMPMVVLVFLFVLSVIIGRRVRENSEALKAEAQKAEQANEAKTMFLANMSHEIRTPLNAIIGFADILNKSCSEVKEREYADVIHRSANTLLSIINDILDLSKIEKGKIVLEFRSFDVHELMAQIVDLYTIRAESKGLRMLYVIDKQVPKMIMGDSLRLSQVISNLLGNAIKFTPEGGTITLSVLMKEIYEEKVFLEFSVKDTGIGIPKEAQEKIFTPFSQADGGVTRTFGGTGLGLTISQKILQAMHSKLELQSFLRQGSTFSFKVFFDRDLESAIEVTKIEGPSRNFGLYPPKLAKHPSYERMVSILNKLGKVDFVTDFGHASDFDLIGLFGHDGVMNDYHTARMYYPSAPIVYIGNDSFIGDDNKDVFAEFYKNPILESHFKSTILDLTNKEQISQEDHPTKYIGKVLVAEDNTTNRLLIQILLEKHGLNVTFAKDGYEAIAYASNHPYDLIFMDIHMPKKDGIGATKEIILHEQDNGKVHVPIVALTANALKGDREKYIQAGMDDYLSKPVTDEDLNVILAKYLKVVDEHDVVNHVLSREVASNNIPAQATSYESIPNDIPMQTLLHTTTADNVTPQTTAYDATSHANAYDTVDLSKKSNSDNLYDKEKVATQIGVDMVILDMLLENFFMTFETDFSRLKNAVDLQDQKEIIEAAHYLKGAASNLHFDKATEMFKDIERFASDGNLDWISLTGVKTYFDTIKETLGYKS